MGTAVLNSVNPANSPGLVLTRRSTVMLLSLTLILSSPLFADASIRIVSQNMNRFFDDVDDGKNEKIFSTTKFYRKIETASAKIIDRYYLPDILALQEIENHNVLSKISDTVFTRSGVRYQVVLIEGNDISAINIAYLIKQKFKIKSVKQLFKNNQLQYDHSLLFSRPPLYLEACIDSNCLTLLNLHLRSMRGIRSNSRGERVRLKRFEQASAIARWIDDFQHNRPEQPLLVLGDYNGLTPADVYVDVVGIILGRPDNSNTEIQATDWIKKDLIDLTKTIPPPKRYSYIYRKEKQILDYMATNSSFENRLKMIAFSRIDYKFSDHAALIADFRW